MQLGKPCLSVSQANEPLKFWALQVKQGEDSSDLIVCGKHRIGVFSFTGAFI